jgi:hypothetical protein
VCNTVFHITLQQFCESFSIGDEPLQLALLWYILYILWYACLFFHSCALKWENLETLADNWFISEGTVSGSTLRWICLSNPLSSSPIFYQMVKICFVVPSQILCIGSTTAMSMGMKYVHLNSSENLAPVCLLFSSPTFRLFPQTPLDFINFFLTFVVRPVHDGSNLPFHPISRELLKFLIISKPDCTIFLFCYWRIARGILQHSYIINKQSICV